MNAVNLIGRLTRDPDVRYTQQGMAVARFSVAIERATKEKEVDYPNCLAFGKTAELIEKYLGKGRLVGINGRLQTGFYEKDGKKVYTTDVVVDRIEFLDRAEKKEEPKEPEPQYEGFEKLEDSIPF